MACRLFFLTASTVQKGGQTETFLTLKQLTGNAESCYCSSSAQKAHSGIIPTNKL
jgi:hypothetical protein